VDQVNELTANLEGETCK